MENNNSNSHQQQHAAIRQHRLSDGAVLLQSRPKNGASPSKSLSRAGNNKRRQTISEGTLILKDNSAASSSSFLGSTSREPSKEHTAPPAANGGTAQATGSSRKSSTPSGQHNHHDRLGLGVASSYYFKGAPKTPMEKMVQSEQKKRLLEKSMEDATTTMHSNNHHMLNSSYLSSSSSDASSRNLNDSSGEADFLGISMSSDTTELAASSYVTLAGTQRLSIFSMQEQQDDGNPVVAQQEEPQKQVQQQQTKDRDESMVPLHNSNKNRRQTIAPMVPKPPADAEQRRRRQSLAVPGLAAATTMPKEEREAAEGPLKDYSSIVQSMKDQRSRRNSSGSNYSRLSLQPSAQQEDNNTSECSISAKVMQDLLLASHQKGSDTHSSGDDSSSSSSKEIPRMKELPESAEEPPGDIEDSAAEPQQESQPLAMMDEEEEPSHKVAAPQVQPPKSPPRIRRGSLLEEIHARRTHLSKSPFAAAKLTSPDPAEKKKSPYQEVDSPARNTRLAQRQRKESSISSTEEDFLASLGSFSDDLLQSPAKGASPTSSLHGDSSNNNNNNDDTASTADLGDLWEGMIPTRSASKKDSTPKKKKKGSSVYQNVDSPASRTRSKQKSAASSADKDSTTESLGDIMQSTALESKPSPTENKPASTAKTYADVDSPARNTRSAKMQRAQQQHLGGENLQELMASIPHDLPSPSNSPPYSIDRGREKVREFMAQKLGSGRRKSLLQHDDDSDDNVDGGKKDDSTITISSITDAGDKKQGSGEKSFCSDKSEESTEDYGEQFDEIARASQNSSSQCANPGESNLNETADSILGKNLDETAEDSGSPSRERSAIAKTQLSQQIIGSPQSKATLAETQDAVPRSLGDSTYSRDSVSQASTLDTPFGMEGKSDYVRDSVGENELPQAPPSTIRFQANLQENAIRMEVDVPGKSPARKRGLTPSKLAPSPRRFLPLGSRGPSGYRKSLTPSKLAPSPLRIKNPVTGGGIISNSPFKKSMTPTKLAGRPPVLLAGQSPSRGSKRGGDDDARNESYLESSAVKRQRTFEHLQGMVNNTGSRNESFELTAETRPEQRKDSTLPRSVLRKKGDLRARPSTRKVAFGSPEIAEFNIASPSMRLTPMPKRKPFNLPDDTGEIEEDMEALFANGKSYIASPAVHKQLAGSTPFASRVDDSSTTGAYLRQDSDSDDDNMSIDQTEHTMELEGNMGELLNSAMGSELSATKATIERSEQIEQPHFEDEPTVPLEPDINTLLNAEDTAAAQPEESERTVPLEPDIQTLLNEDQQHQTEAPSQLKSDKQKTTATQFEGEATVELESDINALFGAQKAAEEEEAQVTVASRKRRSSIGSSRFSIAPSGRLSLSTEASVHDEEIASMEVEEPKTRVATSACLAPEEAFDLTAGDILALPAIQSVYKSDAKDFLVSVSDSLRKFSVSDEVNQLFGQIYPMVQIQTEKAVDESAPLDVSSENLESVLALQRLLRSGHNQEVLDALNQLAATQHGIDTFVWQEWIASGVNLLLEPLDEKCKVVTEEIVRIDMFYDAIDRQLTEWNTSAARKARRQRIEQGKVCRFVGVLLSMSFCKICGSHHHLSLLV